MTMASIILEPQVVPDAVKDRLIQLFEKIQSAYPEEIIRAFVSNAGQPEEEMSHDRKYFSVWVFTDKYVGEIKNPLSNTLRLNFEVVPFANSVDWMRITSQEYDFTAATPKSQMSLDFTTIDGFNGLISSVGEECDDLIQLYRNIFVPNLSR